MCYPILYCNVCAVVYWGSMVLPYPVLQYHVLYCSTLYCTDVYMAYCVSVLVPCIPVPCTILYSVHYCTVKHML